MGYQMVCDVCGDEVEENSVKLEISYGPNVECESVPLIYHDDCAVESIPGVGPEKRFDRE